MNLTDWQKAKDIVSAAGDLPPKEQAAFIEAACTGDATLQEEVESLLAADLDRVSFLETPALKFLDEPSDLKGQQVGAYRIVRELGSGGMGTVYLATRADRQFEGTVAIKILRWVNARPEIEWRFRQEIQILASLNHPNIAKLYEVGHTVDGSPYFIMEYVEGVPVTRFCNERNLSPSERLRLFQKVCGAVQYAHQNLVVHRDLKPSNILVTASGEPKLLDFGIAKLLHTYDSSDPVTATELRFLTPDYASPEQVSGMHITTASDVYSLGVILYELLTGHRPFIFKGLPWQEVRRIICEQEPEAPSVTLKEDSARANPVVAAISKEEVHEKQKHRPRKLRRQLRGDLDNIVLMALRKEPSRRYRSVEQLAGDISAHLEGFPVTAQGDSWRYRTAKFIGRHRLAASMAAAMIILSLGFGMLMALQQQQTARERDRAQQVSDFMKNVFLFVDPKNVKASETSAKEILDRASRLLLTDTDKDPRTRAELLDTLSNIYTHLGLYDTALPLAEEALRSIRQHGSEEDLGVILNELATIHHHKGNYEKAEAMYREALNLLRTSLGPQDPKVARCLNNLAAVLLEKGRYEESEDLFRQALAQRKAFFPGDHPEVIESMNNLAALLIKQGRLSEAETLFREVLRLQQRLHKSHHPDLGLAFHNLGWSLSEQRKYEEAKKYYLLGLQEDRAVYDQDHPSIANTLNNISNTYTNLSRHEEAAAAAQEAVAIYRRRLGENHRRTAIGYSTLAKALFLLRDLPQAEVFARKALDIRRITLQPGHPDITYSLSQLGDILEERGDLTSAERLHRESLDIRKKNRKLDHPDTINGLERLGLFLARQGRHKEAEPLFREALGIATRLYAKTHPQVPDLEKAVAATMCADRDRAKDGEILAEQAVVKLRTAFPPGHWRVADAEAIWGVCLARQTRYAEAEPHLRKAVDDLSRARNRSAAITQRAIRRLVKLYEDWGRPAHAARYRALLTSGH